MPERQHDVSRRLGTQTTTFIAGVRGITTGLADAIQVLIASSGQLGTVSSSRRYKEDIQDMGRASAGLLDLRPVTFRYTQASTDGATPIQYGLIARKSPRSTRTWWCTTTRGNRRRCSTAR